MNIRQSIEKHKAIISYAFFGICTTLVNIACYGVCARILSISVMISTIIAWIGAVAFAYITNRRWVFHSNRIGIKAIFIEVLIFLGCRLITGIFDVIIMHILVDYFNFNDMITKAISNIIMIVLNYIASKMVIFKKHKKENVMNKEILNDNRGNPGFFRTKG